MSKYTTELRWIVESVMGENSTPSGLDYTDEVFKKVGLDRYPIFDEGYRRQLNGKIIDHFYFREIGFETVGQFAFFMRRTMNEIMPYFNQLYATQDLITDPLLSKSLSWHEIWGIDKVGDGTLNSAMGNTGSSTSTTVNNSDSTTADTATYSGEAHQRNVFQDTPMSMLDDEPNMVERLKYATTVTYDDSNDSNVTESNGTAHNEGTSTTSGTSRNDGTRNDTKHDVGREDGDRTHITSGFEQSQAELLTKYRDTFLNIDMMVIEKLEDLFFGLW